MPAHKTYSLLRYVPTFWGLPTTAVPVLLVVGALLTGLFAFHGLVIALALTVGLRVAFDWNDAALDVLRITAVTLRFLDRHGRVRL